MYALSPCYNYYTCTVDSSYILGYVENILSMVATVLVLCWYHLTCCKLLWLHNWWEFSFHYLMQCQGLKMTWLLNCNLLADHIFSMHTVCPLFKRTSSLLIIHKLDPINLHGTVASLWILMPLIFAQYA